MAKLELLEKLAKDIKFLKDEIAVIKMGIEDLMDIHPVRPEYLRKLKRLEKGKFKTYSSVEGLRKEIERE